MNKHFCSQDLLKVAAGQLADYQNDKGELIAFKITQGNRQDVKAAESFLMTLQGLAFGDTGYISKQLFDKLFS